MKILMTIVDEERKEELEAYLTNSGVLGFTEIPRAVGQGVSGRRLGSGAFPKTSAVIFTILEDADLDRVVAGIRRVCEPCGERARMVSWTVDDLS